MHFKKIEFLREFEFIFEKVLALNKGPWTDVLMKKPEGRNTVPLKPLSEFLNFVWRENVHPPPIFYLDIRAHTFSVHVKLPCRLKANLKSTCVG
jgi:hypothetical protein